MQWGSHRDWAVARDVSRRDQVLRLRRIDQPQRPSRSLSRIEGIGGPLFLNGYDRRSWFVVATIGRRPVGYVRCGTARYDETTMLIDEIAVDGSLRRTGIGQKLVRDGLTWGLSLGLKTCETYPKDGRADRVAFFTALGFVPIDPEAFMVMYSISLEEQ